MAISRSHNTVIVLRYALPETPQAALDSSLLIVLASCIASRRTKNKVCEINQCRIPLVEFSGMANRSGSCRKYFSRCFPSGFETRSALFLMPKCLYSCTVAMDVQILFRVKYSIESKSCRALTNKARAMYPDPARPPGNSKRTREAAFHGPGGIAMIRVAALATKHALRRLQPLLLFLLASEAFYTHKYARSFLCEVLCLLTISSYCRTRDCHCPATLWSPRKIFCASIFSRSLASPVS